jgi:toxin ParE1/3/4
MRTITLSPAARHDLADIWEYISRDNEDAATRTIQAIHAQCAALAAAPRMGRNREKDLGEGIRSFPTGNYVLFYWMVADGVEILRVLHGARDTQSLSE